MKAVMTFNGDNVVCLENQNDDTNALYLHSVSDGQVCINCIGHGLIVLDPDHNTVLVDPDWYLDSDIIMSVGGCTYTVRHPVSQDGEMMAQKTGAYEYLIVFQPYATAKIIVDAMLSETSKNPVQNRVITERLNELFTYVSNGKRLVASAITDKGVETASDATFAVMAENIRAISSGGTHTAGAYSVVVPIYYGSSDGISGAYEILD